MFIDNSMRVGFISQERKFTMSATDTQNAAPKQGRKNGNATTNESRFLDPALVEEALSRKDREAAVKANMVEVRKHEAEAESFKLTVALHLAAERPTFPEAERNKRDGQYITWCMKVTGLKHASVFRMLKAAKAAQDPKVGAKLSKLRSVETIALFDSVPEEKREEVLKESGTNPTESTVKAVIERLVPKTPESDARKEQRENKRIEGKMGKCQTALITAFVKDDEKYDSWLALARIIGENDLGSDAVLVVRRVLDSMAVEETGETEKAA